MTVLVNRAKMTTATTGTGTITLGAAVAGYQSFADAGVTNGQIVRYVIEDGINWEIGTGTYTSSGTTLSRTVSESSNADTAISLSGTAQVYITAIAADILQPDNNLSDLANAATARTNLGLGTIATQAANNVSITGGSITGITDLAVSDGGTGASSFTANNVLLGNGTSAFQVVAPGTSGNVLTSNGTTWTSTAPTPGYTDSDVDTHLNTSTATTGEVLSWTGSDYDWVSGGATDINGLSDGYSVGESVGLGSGALANDDGTTNRNTAVGWQSGNAVTSGANNTFFGYRSGYLVSTGSGNTAVGWGSLDTVTTTSGNTAIGQSSGGVYTGSDSTFVGREAGGLSTTGIGQVLVGRSAGLYSTTGFRNIAVGQEALHGSTVSNLTGSYNIGVGYQTGFDLTTGEHNFLGGYQAGTNLTTGSNNVAIGNGALDAATTGGRNIAIGQAAMGLGVATTASGDNIAIGYQAGYDLTTATNNFLGGYRAGTNLTTGSDNIAIGNRSLDAATTGGRNIAIGQDAMGLGVATSSPGRNVVVGDTAGFSITSGSDNVALGRDALLYNTTGYTNTAVGAIAGSNTTTSENVTLVGYNAQASSATVSNEITLGNSSITNLRVPGVGFQFDTTDGLIVPKTVTAGGTTGAQTINKTAGTVNFAAAATSLVVTNSFVDANSIIIATVGTNDATMTSVQAVAAAGSFTLYANVAATAETRVNWFVVN